MEITEMEKNRLYLERRAKNTIGFLNFIKKKLMNLNTLQKERIC